MASSGNEPDAAKVTPPSASDISAIRTLTKKKKPPTIGTPQQMVILYAGKHPEAVKISVHRAFACHYSPVLEAALNSNFIEGVTQTYKLEESREIVVQLLVDWFYTQTIKLEKYDIHFDYDAFEHPKDGLWMDSKSVLNLALIKLYILAEYLLLPTLQNAIIKEMDQLGKSTDTVPILSFHYAWNHTTDDSALREYMLCQCSSLGNGVVSENPDCFPHGLLIELVEFLLRKTRHRARNWDGDLTPYLVEELQS